MLYTPLLPGAAGGTLEPRHVVVPLREQLDRTDLRLGDGRRRRPGAQDVSVALARRPRGGAPLRPADRRARLDLADAARSPGSPSTRSASRRCPRRSRCATGCCSASSRRRSSRRPGGARRAADLRLRRRRLRGRSRGSPSCRTSPPTSSSSYPRCRVAGDALHARRGARAGDDGDPARAGRVRRARAAPARDRDPHADDGRARSRRRRCRCRPARSSRRRTVVWTAGVKPHPVVAKLGLPLDARRADRRRPLLRGRGPPGVWAIGDAAAVPDPAAKGKPVAADRPARRCARRKVAADNVVHALRAAAAAAARSATGRSACSSTWGATRRWRARSASAGAGSRRGSWPAPTTWR